MSFVPSTTIRRPLPDMGHLMKQKQAAEPAKLSELSRYPDGPFAVIHRHVAFERLLGKSHLNFGVKLSVEISPIIDPK